MDWLDNVLEIFFERMAKSKYRHDICPRIEEMMLWRATRNFPQDTHLRIVMDTNVWMLGEDIFTTYSTGKQSGWLLVRAQRHIDSVEHIQVEYFAALRHLILDKGYLEIVCFPGIDIENSYRRRKETFFGLDIWEDLKPINLTFSKGRTFQSYLMSLGSYRPENLVNLPEFERLWFAYDGYSRISDSGKSFLREKLWKNIYEEKWDQQYTKLVDALASGGNRQKQTQDAWNLRMLELKEFGIDYFISLDTTLIKKVRTNRQDGIFDKVRDKVVTPKEFCEQYRIRPIPIKCLAFHDASYPVDLDVIVEVERTQKCPNTKTSTLFPNSTLGVSQKTERTLTSGLYPKSRKY